MFMATALLFPLFTWVFYFTLGYGHLLQTSSEQVRLDALTLSLCHQRAHTLQSIATDANRPIEEIQRLMDVTARATLLVAWHPAAFEAGKKILQTLAYSADPLVLVGNLKASQFMGRSLQRQSDLKTKNQLSETHGNLRKHSLSTATLALIRETHSAERSRYETVFRVRWPKKFVKGPHFEQANREAFTFHAFRQIPSKEMISNDDSQFRLAKLTTFRKVTFAKGVESGCSIASDQYLTNIKVRREK